MKPEILFDLPPEKLRLADNSVHVFCGSLDQSLERMERLAETLSEDERARARRFLFSKDMNRFMAGRGMLREILGWLLQAEPAELIFSYGPNGKPCLAGPATSALLHFNLAHSGSLAVYAVSQAHEVGVDVERIRAIDEAEEITKHFFPGKRMRPMVFASKRGAGGIFFNCWVRKEALLKMCGVGIGESPNPTPGWAGEQLSMRLVVPALNYAVTGYSKVRDIPLKVSDKQVAQQKLNKLVQELEHELAGLIPAKPERETAQSPLLDLVLEYVNELTILGRSADHLRHVNTRLRRLVREWPGTVICG